MTSQEMFSLLQNQIPQVKEIPYPQAPANAPAHEGKPYRDSHLYISCPVEIWKNCAKFLKEDDRLSFDFLTFMTAIDYLKVPAGETPRMDVVYHLFSFKYRHKCVIKIPVVRENSELPSCANLWKAADWQEREVYDMFGIKFEGHPNLKRILMWDGFPGWPLRKDYVHIPDRYDD